MVSVNLFKPIVVSKRRKKKKKKRVFGEFLRSIELAQVRLPVLPMIQVWSNS